MGKSRKACNEYISSCWKFSTLYVAGQEPKGLFAGDLVPLGHRPGCHRLRLVNCPGDLPFARSIHEAKVGRRAGGAATHCVVPQEHVTCAN